jgi:hypothetical protein
MGEAPARRLEDASRAKRLGERFARDPVVLAEEASRVVGVNDGLCLLRGRAERRALGLPLMVESDGHRRFASTSARDVVEGLSLASTAPRASTAASHARKLRLLAAARRAASAADLTVRPDAWRVARVERRARRRNAHLDPAEIVTRDPRCARVNLDLDVAIRRSAGAAARRSAGHQP